MHDRDKNVRLAAIAGLGRAGKDNACNVLITLLLDDDPEILSLIHIWSSPAVSMGGSTVMVTWPGHIRLWFASMIL